MNAAFDIYSAHAQAVPAPADLVDSTFTLPSSSGLGAVLVEGGGVKAPQLLLKDGRSFYVTSDREKWEELYKAGEVVFSEYELQRLRAACAECDDTAARSLADGVLMVKQTFATAYVRRGGKEMINTDYRKEGE